MLAEDDTLIRLADASPRIVQGAISPRPRHDPAPERTLMLGWNNARRQIIELLDKFAYPGSQLQRRLHRTRRPPDRSDRQPQHRHDSLRPDQPDDLEALQPRTCQHVIVLASDGLGTQEADARTLITLLHLRDLAEDLDTVLDRQRDQRRRQPRDRRGHPRRRLRGQREADQPAPDPADREPPPGRRCSRTCSTRRRRDLPETRRRTTPRHARQLRHRRRSGHPTTVKPRSATASTPTSTNRRRTASSSTHPNKLRSP